MEVNFDIFAKFDDLQYTMYNASVMYSQISTK